MTYAIHTSQKVCRLGIGDTPRVNFMLLLSPTLLESNETRLAPVILHGSASDQWGTMGFVSTAVILRGRQGAALADREGLRGTESIRRSICSITYFCES